jgi:hypothetical protein
LYVAFASIPILAVPIGALNDVDPLLGNRQRPTGWQLSILPESRSTLQPRAAQT